MRHRAATSPLLAALLAAIALAPACGRGRADAERDAPLRPSGPPDSALAHDLEVASRVDSAGGAPGDDDRAPGGASPAAPGAARGRWEFDARGMPHRVGAARPAAPPRATNAGTNAGGSASIGSPGAAPAGADAACGSPAPAAQGRCLTALLARSDVELNRTYEALIGALRREAGPGAREPASVARLRVAQRAWIGRRDAACRARTRSREGPLWAPVRAGCLAEVSDRRAAELAAELARHGAR